MKKVITFISTFIIIVIISINSYAKYVIETEIVVAYILVDETKPKIEFISATTNNEGYNNYANSSHIITVKLLATEKNLEENNFLEKTVWMIDNNEATLKVLQKKGPEIWLVPCNKDYETRKLDAKRVKVQGVLSSIIRNYH